MKFYIIVFLLFCAGNLAAQNNIESILRSIEKNNKELQQNEKLFEEQYEPKIKEYCQNYKIGIIQKYQDIVNLLKNWKQQQKTLCPTRMYHTNGNGENRPR